LIDLAKPHRPVVAPVSPATPKPAQKPTATPPPPKVTVTVPGDWSASPGLQGIAEEALGMVRYDWQRFPNYAIHFLPIGDAPFAGAYSDTQPSPGWGSYGYSDLYVFPGESAAQLAGITTFEIGHEVDYAVLAPAGGRQAIENDLGIHPATWVPNCNCAEQNFMSGWFAAAFSDFWSPGVGQW
jgi:hypothetical protein